MEEGDKSVGDRQILNEILERVTALEKALIDRYNRLEERVKILEMRTDEIDRRDKDIDKVVRENARGIKANASLFVRLVVLLSLVGTVGFGIVIYLLLGS